MYSVCGKKGIEMISIITPTYNRAGYLTRLKNSLMQQTCDKFEWIIVDDGSEDNTKEIIEGWGGISIPYIYLYKENGGKHTAINYAMPYVNGDFVFFVDSDDYLTEDAIEKITKWTKDIQNNKKIAGVSGTKGYGKEALIGEYPQKEEEYIECSNLDRRKKHLTGDKAEVYKTEILRKYPFPVFEGERFLTESVVWNSIARDGYVLRWYGDIIYICEYLENGLTNNGSKLKMNNFKGYTYSVSINVSCLKGKEKYAQLIGYMSILSIKYGKCHRLRRYLPQLRLYEIFFAHLFYKIWQLKHKLL